MHPNRSNKKLSICHIASGDLWAGAEVQIFHLLSELKKIESLQISAIVHNKGELASRLQSIGVQTKIFDEKKLNFFQLVRRSRRFFKEEQIDIIHSHRYKENIVAAIASMGLILKPRLIQTIHGLSHPRRGKFISKMKIYSIVDGFCRKLFFNKIVAVSKELYIYLSNYENLNKLRYIQNGIALNRVHKSLVERKIFSREKIIAVVGRLVPVKNFQVFIQSIPKMLEHRQDIRFLVIGDGPERESLKKLTVELSIEKYVEFTGHTNDMDVLWSKIDIYVLCSRHEGLSIALLEAMANGVLVVATAVGGNSEVVQSGVNGILIPEGTARSIANGCLHLLTLPNEQILSIKFSAMKTIAKNYSSKISAKHYLQMYKELLLI
jgi:glycosyltransferase involved in cell wall biosynthesis